MLWLFWWCSWPVQKYTSSYKMSLNCIANDFQVMVLRCHSLKNTRIWCFHFPLNLSCSLAHTHAHSQNLSEMSFYFKALITTGDCLFTKTFGNGFFENSLPDCFWREGVFKGVWVATLRAQSGVHDNKSRITERCFINTIFNRDAG